MDVVDDARDVGDESDGGDVGAVDEIKNIQIEIGRNSCGKPLRRSGREKHCIYVGKGAGRVEQKPLTNRWNEEHAVRACVAGYKSCPRLCLRGLSWGQC